MSRQAFKAAFPRGGSGQFADDAAVVKPEMPVTYPDNTTDLLETPMEPDRYQRGQQTLKNIHGHIGEGVMAALKDIAPDFARLIIEFPYGDIYSRGILSPRERQIATIASLTTLGSARTELKAHIQGALNVGCSRQDVVEVIMQMAVYAGFPAAVNAMLAAKEVFAELDQQSRPA